MTKFYGESYFSNFYLKSDQYEADLKSFKSNQDNLLKAFNEGSGTNLTWFEFGKMTNEENRDNYQNITNGLSLLENLKINLTEFWPE